MLITKEFYEKVENELEKYYSKDAWNFIGCPRLFIIRKNQGKGNNSYECIPFCEGEEIKKNDAIIGNWSENWEEMNYSHDQVPIMDI